MSVKSAISLYGRHGMLLTGVYDAHQRAAHVLADAGYTVKHHSGGYVTVIELEMVC